MTDSAVTGGAAQGPIPEGGSIRRRVTLALVGVSALTLVVVGVAFYGFLGDYVLRQKQEQLLDHTVSVAAQMENLWSVADLRSVRSTQNLALLLRIDTQVLPAGGGITIFRAGEVVAAAGPRGTTDGQAPLLYEAGSRIAGGGPAATTLSGADGGRLIVAASRVSLDSEPGLVVVSLPTSAAVADRRGLFGVLLLSGLFGIGLAVLVGFVLGSWLTRPLKRLSAAARGMAVGSYAEAVQGRYPGELYELASSLETMRREVRRSEQSLRGFVASAAHELRTPLTSIEGFSQALLDGTADTLDQRQRSAAAIYRESGRLRRLVDALLTLSRFDSREFHPARVPVDGARLVWEEVERLVEAGLAQPGRVHVTAEGSASLVTDPDMLRQVVGNLLRNAVLYGGEEPIQASVAPRNGRFVVEVSNGGPPLEAADRAHVFDRFHRGQSAQRVEGFGLGLPLVREICGVLGGQVELTDDYPRTVFRVTLPLSSEDGR